MKKLIYLFILFFCLNSISCQKNLTEEFEKRIETISKSGGKILYQTASEHKIVYQKEDKIILDNLEKEIILYSDTNQYELRWYNADFLSDGAVTINPFEPEKITLSEKIKNNYNEFKDCKIKCINGDFLLIDSYLICIAEPNIVYDGISFSDRLDLNGNLVVEITGNFTRYPNNNYDFRLIDPMLFYRGGCYFGWEIIIGKKGDVVSKADYITVYDEKIPITALTGFNIVETRYMPLIELSMYINENL